MINADDVFNGRFFPNKQLKYLFSDPTTSNIIEEFEENEDLGGAYYRNTCTHNSDFAILEDETGYIAAGSHGIVRRGKYTDKDGIEKNGAFKIFISTNNLINPYEQKFILYNLMEIKYGIELMKSIPESVVHIELVNSCKILKSTEGEDNFLQGNDIFIVGMEYGESFIDFLKKSDPNTFSTILSQSMDAFGNLNRHGYFHRDVKLQNIVLVNRNGSYTPVIIDFGRTEYFNDGGIEENVHNIPIDAFYLGLNALHNLNLSVDQTRGIRADVFTHKKNKKKIIVDLCWKFYRILDTFQPGNVDNLIIYFASDLNDDFWDQNVYGVQSSFYKFKKLLLKYHPDYLEKGNLNDSDIQKYIINRNINSGRIKLPDNIYSFPKQYFIDLLKKELSMLPSISSSSFSRRLPSAQLKRSGYAPHLQLSFSHKKRSPLQLSSSYKKRYPLQLYSSHTKRSPLQLYSSYTKRSPQQQYSSHKKRSPLQLYSSNTKRSPPQYTKKLF